MSSSALMTIGMRAMFADYASMQTTGHNIANANTPGYSRQRVQLGSALPVQLGSLLIGSGVDAGKVQRSVDELLGRRIQGQRSLLGGLAAQRGGLSDVESLFAEPSENGLGSLLDGFFAGLSQLSTAPTDSILRTSALQASEEANYLQPFWIPTLL